MRPINPDIDGEVECPRCEGSVFSVLALPDPVYLHMILNPGLMVTELFLGLRMPNKMMVCETCPGPVMSRVFIHCSACGTTHEPLIWSGRNGFGHWLGLICPDCGARIPYLLNVTSWLVWSKLSPVFWLLWWLFGKRYLAWERKRAVAERDRLQARSMEQFNESHSSAPEQNHS